MEQLDNLSFGELISKDKLRDDLSSIPGFSLRAVLVDSQCLITTMLIPILLFPLPGIRKRAMPKTKTQKPMLSRFVSYHNNP